MPAVQENKCDVATPGRVAQLARQSDFPAEIQRTGKTPMALFGINGEKDRCYLVGELIMTEEGTYRVTLPDGRELIFTRTFKIDRTSICQDSSPVCYAQAVSQRFVVRMLVILHNYEGIFDTQTGQAFIYREELPKVGEPAIPVGVFFKHQGDVTAPAVVRRQPRQQLAMQPA